MATSTSPTHALAGPALDNRRIGAAAIDLAAPALAGIALFVTDLLTPATALVLVGWTLYYFFALETGGGQTLGKRLMNLKVVSADGGEATMHQYAMRSLVRVIDLPGIGLVAMLGSGDRRQRLGDMVAHTSVVDASGPDLAQMDAFDAAHLNAQATPVEAEPKPAKPAKSGRPSLGGPELKMPSFGRSKTPKEPKAPKEPKPAKSAKSGRPSLGGPELKMPSFGRSKTPKEPKAPKEP
ncbi:MAG TPA: RDD family protein, partial [Thermoleophilaceae bacterium]|nr:RDD family protein [Thermoleophilaceae bacterium]